MPAPLDHRRARRAAPTPRAAAIAIIAGAAIAPHTLAAPALQAITASPPRQAPIPIATQGPFTIEPRPGPSRGAAYLVRFEFNQPILAVKEVTTTAGAVRAVHCSGDTPWVVVEIAELDNDHYATVNLGKVASATGVASDISASIAFLEGDYTRDGVVDARDLVGLLPGATTPTPPRSLGLNSSPAPAPAPDANALLDAARQPRTLPNIPPTSTELGPILVRAGAPSFIYRFTVRDERAHEANLLVSAQSSDTDLIPNHGVTLRGNGPTRELIIRPAPGQTGAANIVLTISDAELSTQQVIPVIVKQDQPPDARFTINHHLGPAPLAVAFDASNSSDPLDNIAHYAWNFGDGATAYGRATSHTFTQPGHYPVTLTVTDWSGLATTETHYVTVADNNFSLNDPISEQDARRFLWQAAFGPTDADVQQVMQLGYEAWIDQQLALPPTLLDYALVQQNNALGFGSTDPSWIFDDFAVEAPDQLRQRMAWALIQIIVMNRDMDGSNDEAAANYYSMYIQNALGNYRDLLADVTFSYPMAVYLTYASSAAENPNTGAKPDENYARELKQLFSIGLWRLLPDGQRATDVFNDHIQTYDNEDIQEFARVFTGLRRDGSSSNPIVPRVNLHDFNEKQLLKYPDAVPNGGLIPAGPPTQQGVYDNVHYALDNVFHHPSFAPFIARRLIQRLTASNPTPAYVQRVAQALEGAGPYGAGVRGDLAAAAKAILLDPEARDPQYRQSPFAGKVLEPQVIHFGLYRALARVDRPSQNFPFRINANPNRPVGAYRQGFLRSPSVFNFYRPDFAPVGSEIDRADLAAPELQILDDLTAFEAPNLWGREVINETDAGERSPFYDIWLQQADGDDAALVDLVISDLAHAPFDSEVRDIIVNAVTAVNGDNDKVRAAVTLVVSAPEFTILK